MSKTVEKRITRNREVKSCENCIVGKRKCDKEKPTCERCMRLCIVCSYPKKAVNKRLASGAHLSEDSYASLRFLVEADDDKTGKNFQIVTNLTGELSVFIPSNLFPFYGLSTNLDEVFAITQGNSGLHDMFDFSRLTTKKLSIRQLKAKIPPRDLGDFLISHFFDEIFPVVPILDRDDFLLKWQSYWKDPISFIDLNAMILLFGVFFSSCASIQLNSVYGGTLNHLNPDFEKLKIEYYDCVENIRYMLKTDVCPSIPAILSLSIMYYVSSLNCYGLAAAVSTLQRYCQMAGLHRKTSNTSVMPLKEILYGFVTFLDSLVSVYHGLPTQVDSRVSEIMDISDKLPENMYIAGFMARFFCARICAIFKTSLNEVQGPSKADLRNMKKRLKKVRKIVNSINEKILSSQDLSHSDKRLLKAGNQLFLRRAAYFFVAMKIFVKANVREKPMTPSVNDRELITQSLLLMNESFILINQLPSYRRACLWFVRNTYPLEAVLIVISNLESHPAESLNFSQLCKEELYTKCASIDYNSGDLREVLLEKCCDALLRIECLWPPILRNLFRKILDIKESKLFKRRKSQDEYLEVIKHDTSQRGI